MAKRKAKKQRYKTQKNTSPKTKPPTKSASKSTGYVPSTAANYLKQSIVPLRRNNVEAVASLISHALNQDPNAHEQAVAKSILTEAYFRAAVTSETEKLKYLAEAIEISPQLAKLHHYRVLVLWQDYLENQTSTANSLQKVFVEMLDSLDTAYEIEPSRKGIVYLREIIKLALHYSNFAKKRSSVKSNFTNNELPLEHLDENEQSLLENIKDFFEVGNISTDNFNNVFTDNGVFTGELWALLSQMKLDDNNSPTKDLHRFSQNLRKVGGISQRVRGIIHYYLGVAEARQENLARAFTIWTEAKRLTYNSTHLKHNLGHGQIEHTIKIIENAKWAQAIKLLLPFTRSGQLDSKMQRTIDETLAYAHDNLAYEAAQSGNWLQAQQQWEKAWEYNNQRHLLQNIALAEEALENWSDAASAWRDLLKRRPRKESNPEYLSDRQVMALWRHAAQCYLKDRHSPLEESLHCWKKAVEYADTKEELAIRQEMVDCLEHAERYDASRNELKRILELDPENMQALLKLASFYDEENSWWQNDSMPFWKRAVKLDPQNQEAKDGLAKGYIKQLERASPKEIEKILTQALEILPDHPKLLIFKAEELFHNKKFDNAAEVLEQAYELAPENKENISDVLSKLALLDNEAKINVLLAEVRQLKNLSPIFWIRLADDVYEQVIGEQSMATGRLAKMFGRKRTAPKKEYLESTALKWIKTFLDEGIDLATKNEQLGKPLTSNDPIQSKIEAFMFAYESVDATKDNGLINYYKHRIKKECKDIGLLEYVEAFTLYDDTDEPSIKKQANILLQTAIQKAKKQKCKAVIEAAKNLKTKLNSPIRGMAIPKELERILEELDLD